MVLEASGVSVGRHTLVPLVWLAAKPSDTGMLRYGEINKKAREGKKNLL